MILRSLKALSEDVRLHQRCNLCVAIGLTENHEKAHHDGSVSAAEKAYRDAYDQAIDGCIYCGNEGVTVWTNDDITIKAQCRKCLKKWRYKEANAE